MTAADKFRDYLRAIYAPADRRGIVEWSEQELHLTERQSNMPGQFRTRRTPYMRRPLECFGDPDVTDVILCWGSQVGKTTMIQAGVCWRIVNKPSPMVWVMPNEKLAQSFSETRMIPIFEDSPAVAAEMPSDRRKFKKLEQQFRRCTLAFVGSNSPPNLASRPAGLLLMDEVDKFREETDKETSALLLAENRTKSFDGALRVKTSTPTTDQGAIWQAFLTGTQEKFFLPCPHCGEFVELTFAQIKWAQDAKDKDGVWNLARVNETAYFECPKCGGHWSDGQKIEALQKGEWRATNSAAEPGAVSFHLPSFYAPWRSCTFGAAAVKFLRDKNSANGMRDFRNGFEALPWIEEGSEIEETDIDRRRAEYPLGSVPDGVEVARIILGADVAQAFTNYVVRAFAPTGESWLIDYGRLAGLSDLVAWAEGARWAIGGRERGIEGGLIDSGYQPESVYRACLDARHRKIHFMPSKGSGEKFVSKPVRATDIVIGGRTLPKSLLIYSDNDYKRMLYMDSIRDGRGPWWIPQNVGRDYIDEMLKERTVTRANARGYDETVWKRFGANHYADAEKLALVFYDASRGL